MWCIPTARTSVAVPAKAGSMAKQFKSRDEFKKAINSFVYSSVPERDWYQTFVCDSCDGEPLTPPQDIEDYSSCWCCGVPFGDHLSKKLHYHLFVPSADQNGISFWCRSCKKVYKFKENIHVNHYRCYCCGGQWDSLRKLCLRSRKTSRAL